MFIAHRPSWRLTAALAAVTSLLGVTAATASAERGVVEHFVDSYTFVYQGGPEFCGDLGFDVVEQTQGSGVFVATRRGPDGLWYAGARFRATTWTNPDSDGEFRMEYAGTDRDQVVTDNGDGTVTVQIQLTGPSRYYVDDQLTFVDTGMVRFRLVIDQANTPDDWDDDEVVAALGIDALTGLRQTDGRDFCADLQEFIG